MTDSGNAFYQKISETSAFTIVDIILKKFKPLSRSYGQLDKKLYQAIAIVFNFSGKGMVMQNLV